MSRQKKIRKIYYHVLEGSRYLFADERSKKKFLDLLFEIEKEEEWTIYAFCIIDDSAYFIIEAAGSGVIRRGMRQLANEFFFRCQEELLYLEKQGLYLYSGRLEELNSLAEIAVCCREIHRIPLEKGYVTCLDDYWWSSYITYTGEYDWELVDCRVFSLCFSANPEIAKSKLQLFHR